MSNKGGELYNAERELITRTVTTYGTMEAAKLLGVGKTTIYRKLKEYKQLEDIPVPKSQLIHTMERCVDYLLGFSKEIPRELGLALQKEIDNLNSFGDSVDTLVANLTAMAEEAPDANVEGNNR